MAINRRELVTRHNPILTEADESSPLSVGNGNFAFTADITGMQTLYGEYRKVTPLCTMAQWGWHTRPVSRERYGYSLEDVEMTEYPYEGRTVRYAVERKKGNEAVYDWVRQNPHKLNLGRIGLVMDGESVDKGRLSDVRQELDLYEGILNSRFCLDGMECQVRTACGGEKDIAAFLVQSEALGKGLAVELSFPYGSPDISASDWESEDAHVTEVAEREADWVLLKRTLDRDVYYVGVTLENCRLVEAGVHRFRILPAGQGEMGVTVHFLKDGWDGGKALGAGKAEDVLETGKALGAGKAENVPGTGKAKATGKAIGPAGTEKAFEDSRAYWREFWEKGGVIDLHKSRDGRALELERRIVLSQYLLALQSAGDMPPQETGLTCNSWYGKAHLEMYFWHEAYLPLFGHRDLLERSLSWYVKHLPEAKENAARNGYRGARWPKMVSESCVDCPSPIATLLIWQQPHIIYMLEMAYQCGVERDFLERYYEVVEETARFMADFAVFDEERGVYELRGPVIPVQENHDPVVTKNPAFEVEYWGLTLKIAAEWARRLDREVPEEWIQVAEHMAPMAVKDGCYLAHDNCPDTYGAYAQDHPSMLCAYGLMDGGRTDREIMGNSLERVVECWDYPSLWGWDFAVMAMTAVRLGKPERAIELLLMDTFKNRYVVSGNNFQEGRGDLPLYLPGNGSLLLAAALMTAGYPGSGELPGFPEDGEWVVEFEGVKGFPC